MMTVIDHIPDVGRPSNIVLDVNLIVIVYADDFLGANPLCFLPGDNLCCAPPTKLTAVVSFWLLKSSQAGMPGRAEPQLARSPAADKSHT